MTPFDSPYRLVTHAAQPIPRDIEQRIVGEGWPAFMLEDPVANMYYTRWYSDFPAYQFVLYDGEMVVALCNSIPFKWDGNLDSLSPRGWDWVMEKAMKEYDAGVAPNAMSALSITIAASHKGKGVSQYAVAGMKQIARQNGMEALFAPVRPSLKSSYPLTPIERYITWTTAEGAPFDPWIRVHWRAGARIIKACIESMVIPGTLAEWEGWTGMRFPENGLYIVPDALVPVRIEPENDWGEYIEPNVWMQHQI